MDKKNKDKVIIKKNIDKNVTEFLNVDYLNYSLYTIS